VIDGTQGAINILRTVAVRRHVRQAD
jgi:hypothetical protein